MSIIPGGQFLTESAKSPLKSHTRVTPVRRRARTSPPERGSRPASCISLAAATNPRVASQICPAEFAALKPARNDRPKNHRAAQCAPQRKLPIAAAAFQQVAPPSFVFPGVRNPAAKRGFSLYFISAKCQLRAGGTSPNTRNAACNPNALQKLRGIMTLPMRSAS